MRTYTHDAYSPLDIKTDTSGDTSRRPGVQSWVPAEHARRLAAYTILDAFASNIARNFLPKNLTAEQIAKYREYGHADRIVAGAVSAVLGDEQTIHVPGAKEVDLETGATEQPAEVRRAQAALAYLLQWAKDERLWMEMAEAEIDDAKLGDALWTLQWDPDKNRARVVTYDPGFYFPVPDLASGKDFHRRLHLAWEETDAAGVTELHRMTWSLDPIRPARDPDSPIGALSYLYTDDGAPVLQPGDRLDSQGRIVRDYPWNTRDSQPIPSAVTCHFTEAVFSLQQATNGLYALDFLDEGSGSPLLGRTRPKVRYLAREVDLGLDFLPVVHVPNTPSRRAGFGRSMLTMIVQILDDLSSTDTDLAESGSLVGSATLITKGGPPGDVVAGPGRHIDLPVDGSAEYLDVSKNLDALLKLKTTLLKDLAVNTRLTDAVLGRTDGANAVSGLALALSFSPLTELVRSLRRVRDEKYSLLLKMVLRMAQANGDLDPGPTPEALVLLGSFLPADRQEAVKLVAEAIKAKVMSLETGIRYLQEQGIPVEDAVLELERIQHRDLAGAVQLVDATGKVADAYAYLGLEPAEPAASGGE